MFNAKYMHYQSPFLRNKLQLENRVELKLDKLLFISRGKKSLLKYYILEPLILKATVFIAKAKENQIKRSI